ncbi:aminotransferase class IV, partial [Streptomyces sp. 2MCAF27]
LVPWDAAQVHVLTQSLHYGWAVYEGIRVHETAEGPAVFRLRDHLARLTCSARVCLMDIPYAEEELAAATVELVRAGGATTRTRFRRWPKPRAPISTPASPSSPRSAGATTTRCC